MNNVSTANHELVDSLLQQNQSQQREATEAFVNALAISNLKFQNHIDNLPEELMQQNSELIRIYIEQSDVKNQELITRLLQVIDNPSFIKDNAVVVPSNPD